MIEDYTQMSINKILPFFVEFESTCRLMKSMNSKIRNTNQQNLWKNILDLMEKEFVSTIYLYDFAFNDILFVSSVPIHRNDNLINRINIVYEITFGKSGEIDKILMLKWVLDYSSHIDKDDLGCEENSDDDCNISDMYLSYKSFVLFPYEGKSVKISKNIKTSNQEKIIHCLLKSNDLVMEYDFDDMFICEWAKGIKIFMGS